MLVPNFKKLGAHLNFHEPGICFEYIYSIKNDENLIHDFHV